MSIFVQNNTIHKGAIALTEQNESTTMPTKQTLNSIHRLLIFIILFCVHTTVLYASQHQLIINSCDSLNDAGYIILKDDPEKAFLYFQKAEKLALDYNLYSNRCESMMYMAYVFEINHNYDSALTNYKSIMEYGTDVIENETVCTCLDGCSRTSFRMQLLDDAKNYAELLLKESKELKFVKFQDKAYRLIADIQHAMTNIDSAIYYLNISLKLNREINSPSNLLLIYNKIAALNSECDNFVEALKYYDLAASTSKSCNSEKLDMIYNNMGNVFSEIRNYDRAEKYYNEALDINLLNNNNPMLKIQLHTNLALLKIQKEQYDNALNHLYIAQELTQKNPSLDNLARIYNAFGACFEKKADYHNALIYHKLYYSIADSMQNTYELSVANNNIGIIYMRLENYSTAKQHLLKALELNNQINNNTIFIDIYKSLSKCYEEESESYLALKYLKLHYNYLDSVSLINKQFAANNYLLSKSDREKNIAQKNLSETIESTELEMSKKEEEKNFLLFIILLSFIIVVLILNKLYFKNKMSKLLKSKNDELLTINSRLSDEIDYRIQTENELLKAKKDLLTALEAEKRLHTLKTRFVSMVSHEYRTPLTVIMTSAELLEPYFRMGDSLKHKKQVKNIKKSVSSMVQLLTNVLTYGKGEQGQYNVSMVNINIVELMNDIIRETALVHNNSHKYVFDQSFEKIEMKTDFDMMHQIFGNLLSNAAKYSESNSTITIKILNKENSIVFEISDNGIGISEEDQKGLFNHFHRGQNIGNVPGTGLGLAIVKRSVESLKGQIEVESQLNEGTCFTVSFPIEKNCLKA